MSNSTSSQGFVRSSDWVGELGLEPRVSRRETPAGSGRSLVSLQPVSRTNERMLMCMGVHYSRPKGFVGRNICYAVMGGETCYGMIVGGSATKFLPGRNEFFGMDKTGLRNVVNNIFFHVERQGGKYPCRWFTVRVLELFRARCAEDWLAKYGDAVIGFESLVEKPRTGECYQRDGWTLVGETKGYTCKRTAGKGTDSWSGKRVWDTDNLRPKLVFARHSESPVGRAAGAGGVLRNGESKNGASSPNVRISDAPTETPR